MRRDRDAEGFTLVEVLVAFFIAALTLTMALRVLGEGAGWARRGPAASLRLEEAASLLDAAVGDADIRPGDRTGVFGDGQPWQVRISDAAGGVAAAGPGRLLRIEVLSGGVPLLATLAAANPALRR